MSYEAFLRSKRVVDEPTGILNPPELHSSLFGFQRDVVRWALRRGRAALFEECGLGKSRQAIEWARVVHEHTGLDVLILTPLAVAEQFVREAAAIGVVIQRVRESSDVRPGINVANYERLHKLDASRFGGVVLDESSILKAKDSKTRRAITEAFRATRFKLACTATPAPNDHVELGNHAEFLGIMSQTEMLSTFFVHDGGSTQDWRLKGHAANDFWRWVCSWAVCLTKPSDLGYPDDGYELPELRVHQHTIECDQAMAHKAGVLFAFEAATLAEQRAARKASLVDRVAKCAEMVNASTEQWIVWCDLNAESEALAAAIPGAVEVTGSDSDEHKEQSALDFIDDKARVIVTKPSIFGFGVNLQCAHNAAFVGLSHSFEQLHQAIRREWRFGQTHPVDAHIITSSAEGAVVRNVQRKQEAFAAMIAGMAQHMSEFSKSEIQSAARESLGYAPVRVMTVPTWVGAEA